MKHVKKGGLAVKRNVIFLSMLPGLFLFFVGFCPEQGMAGRESLPARASDQVLNKTEILAKAASISNPFVKNVGQFAGEVTYAADLFAGRFFLTGKELVYSLSRPAERKVVRPDQRGRDEKFEKGTSANGLVFREFFIDHKGARIDFKSMGEQQAETAVSYFRGSDPSRWRSGVASYQGVSLGQVYPGVEVKLKASNRNVEKVFYVSPRVDVGRIKIGVAGVAGLKIAKDGRLLLKSGFGELAMRAPVAWQEIAGRRCDVKVGYRLLANNQYGFSVTGSYDKNHALIIDPDLDIMAATFLGGSDFDYGLSLVLDGSGNVYMSGSTDSFDFPTTKRAYDRTPNRIFSDVYISKLDGSLTKLLASTYLGGDNSDSGHCLALDGAGNVVLLGRTNSSNFPTTTGAYDQSLNGSDGSDDLFVSKLDSNLMTLIASTYLGGGKTEFFNSLALDDSGKIYLTGTTYSPDFPTTDGAYDRHFGSFADVAISKLDANLSRLLASTYLGGEFGDDIGGSLALDGLGNVYLTGATRAVDFPTTPGAYDRICDRIHCHDAFVSKLDDRLTTLKASTFIGGDGWDGGESLALDQVGNVYLTGGTTSTDFPTTTWAYHQSHNGSLDVFVSKLNSDLTWLLASTYLGGSRQEFGVHIALDRSSNVYITGETYSTDFPVTTGSYIGGKTDIYFLKLSCDLTKLQFSSYLGGSDAINDSGGEESANSLALDDLNNVFLAGMTSSGDFPITAGSYDRTHNGQKDAFVVKLHTLFSVCTPGTVSDIVVISPDGSESWLAGTIQSIAWKTIGTSTTMKIEYSFDMGVHWIEVVAATANNGIYPWTVPATPSRLCLVRISDAANPAISDASDAVFSILLDLDLQAERREIKAFSVMRQYGAIQFLGAISDYPIAQYRLMRRKGDEGFITLETIAPSELQNNQFQMQDKYLEKGTHYTYRVEAFGANGELIGISSEKSI